MQTFLHSLQLPIAQQQMPISKNAAVNQLTPQLNHPKSAARNNKPTIINRAAPIFEHFSHPHIFITPLRF